MPIGFGAERSNLMDEQAVSMPNTYSAGLQNADDGVSQQVAASTISNVDENLYMRANNAKTQLI